jgi:formamidopyrimidine-DNA glycosylase
MPELPEVEIIVRELKRKIVGEIVADVCVLWQKCWAGFTRGEILLKTIQNVSRKGKYIIIHLTSGYLIVHLRMTGQLIVNGDESANANHLRVLFKFESGNNMLFYDARKFGRIYFTFSPEDSLSKIGIDALHYQFTSNHLKKIMNNRKIGLKKFFLDQVNVAGLGNIYIDESLFRAGLHPERSVSSLETKEIKGLYYAIKSVLTDAIDNMGTTISDYKTTGGGFGEFQNRLNVYGRADMPCVSCSEPIQKKRINSRGTHFCPNCQG